MSKTLFYLEETRNLLYVSRETFLSVKLILLYNSNCSGRSKQQATGLRAASVGAKRVPPGLSTPRIAFAAFV